MPSLNIDEILKCLPHRYPFLLVDRVVDYSKGESLTAIKNVSVNEPFFTGHFPESPVMPGVLMVEALAQACGILIDISEPRDKSSHMHVLAGVDKVRFKHLVQPGDQLQLNVKIINHRRHIWKCSGEVMVLGKLVCSAQLKSALTPV